MKFGETLVGVAQLVEPRVVIPVVVGSSPIVHPKFKVTGFFMLELSRRPGSIVGDPGRSQCLIVISNGDC